MKKIVELFGLALVGLAVVLMDTVSSTVSVSYQADQWVGYPVIRLDDWITPQGLALQVARLLLFVLLARTVVRYAEALRMRKRYATAIATATFAGLVLLAEPVLKYVVLQPTSVGDGQNPYDIFVASTWQSQLYLGKPEVLGIFFSSMFVVLAEMARRRIIGAVAEPPMWAKVLAARARIRREQEENRVTPDAGVTFVATN